MRAGALSRARTVGLAALAVVWVYPVVWTLINAVRSTSDLYRGVLDVPLPPAVGNLMEAWERAHLGQALLNSTIVAALTVAGALLIAAPAAFALARLRPPARAALTLVVLAPLIIPTEVLVVPLFGIYRGLGLIDSLVGLALVNVVSTVSFATVILMGFFRRIPQDVIDAGRLDGAGRTTLLTAIALPLARPGVVVVALLVAIFSWNDFGAALVLLQQPSTFTAPLALTTFSTFYATDEGLRFAGLAIILLPPLIVFLILQRRALASLTPGADG